MKTQREKLEWLATTRLLTLKRNPQYLTPRQMESLKISIKRDGFVAPILVRSIGSGNFEVVSGNHRLMAARELKRTHVPCVIVKMSDRQAKRLAVNLNLIHGDPPAELLAPFLAELDDATLREIHLEGDLRREVIAFDKDLAKLLKSIDAEMPGISNDTPKGGFPNVQVRKVRPSPRPILGRPEEYPRAKDLLNQGKHPTFIGRETVSRNARNGGLMFWQLDGQDCAVSLVNPKIGSLLVLCVLREHRGAGIGHFVVNYLRCNFARVLESAVPFFQGCGYQQFGGWKYGRRFRTAIMARKDLLGLGGRLQQLEGDSNEGPGLGAVDAENLRPSARRELVKADRLNRRHPSKRKGLARADRK